MSSVPISPVVSGLMRGFAMGEMLRQSAMDRERFERERVRADQEAQMGDIRGRMLMEEYTRPVTAGMVEEQVNLGKPKGFEPTYPATKGGEGAELPISASMRPSAALLFPQETTLVRKADPKRAVKYKTRDGETIEGEMLTRAEQVKRAQDEESIHQRMLRDRKIEEVKATANAQAEAQRAQKYKDREAFGTPIGEQMAKDLKMVPGTKVLPSEYDDLIKAQEALKKAGKKGVKDYWLNEDDQGNRSIGILYETGETEEKPLGQKGKIVSKTGAGAGQARLAVNDAEKRELQALHGKLYDQARGDPKLAMELLDRMSRLGDQGMKKHRGALQTLLQRAVRPNADAELYAQVLQEMRGQQAAPTSKESWSDATKEYWKKLNSGQ